MFPTPSCPVVHLELRTGDLPRACTFLTRQFGWRAETVHVASQSYVALGWGSTLEVGVVEHDRDRPCWVPYLEVSEIRRATQRAQLLGAAVQLEPREGPVGWRSIIATPDGADIGLWQAKA